MLFIACVAGIFTLCCSMRISNLNVNTWSVCIGEKKIIGSGKNERGDTTCINRKMFNYTDSLYVSEYICGGTIMPPQISLKVSKDDLAGIEIELSRNRWGRSVTPINKLLDGFDYKNLTIEVYSSYNHYYDLDRNSPMCVLIVK